MNRDDIAYALIVVGCSIGFVLPIFVACFVKSHFG